MPYHQQRDARIGELLQGGMSYDEVSVVMNLPVRILKGVTARKYPTLHAELRSPRGRRPSTAEDLNARLQQQEEDAAAYRQRLMEKNKHKRAIADHFLADVHRTLQETGEEFGVTREYVRQLVNQYYPGRYQAKKDARKRAQAKKVEAKAKYCRVCGERCSSGRWAFCSEEHRRIGNEVLRYHLDEEFRDVHRLTVAKWVLADPEKRLGKGPNRQHLRRYYEKLAAGEEVEDHGRWLIKGSKAMKAATEAYVKGWPVFANLPEQIQEQVKKEVGQTRSSVMYDDAGARDQ